MIWFLRNRKTLGRGVAVVLSLQVLTSCSGTQKNGLKWGSPKKGNLVSRVTIAGMVQPAKKTVIMAPYHGYVRKLFVKIGDHVKEGDPVVSVSQSLLASEQVFPLRAPFTGVVVQVEKAEGEYVREGDPKEFILRIDDLTHLQVVAQAPEIDRAKIRIGQEATVKASAVLNRSYRAKIRDLALAAKEKEQWGRSQVEFSIRLDVLDKDEQLRPGMSVIMDIETDKRENILSLRHEFIQKEKDKFFVTLKGGAKKTIEVGIQNEEAYEIISGIKESDEIQMVDFSTLVETSPGN